MGNKMINCLCLYMRKAIPFGLQHVLAMFVANLAPVLIVCSAALVRGMVSSAGRCPDPLCLVARYVLKGVYKNLNILVGLIFGYILSIIFTVAGIAPMVDFSGIQETIDQVGFFSIPKLVFFTSHKPVFNLGSFLTIAIVFLVSAAETTGATTAVCTGALGRDLKMEELQGSLAVDGFSSAISGCFGCLPLTSFSQNVGLVTMTRVINRFTIFIGALILILASLFPPLGAFFNSLPQAVLGGCTVMMFGSIMYEGIKMLKNCEFNDRTMIVVSLLLSLLLPKKKQAN